MSTSSAPSGASADLPESLFIPPEVLSIVRTLEGAGFETWCVGGAVRDSLLEKRQIDPRDYDLATSARPEQVQRLFRRTIPVGVEHGTVAVLDRNNEPHEVTTFRRDVQTDGRHAIVEFGVSLDDDLARRDFTVNAIAYRPLEKGEWRDPFGGMKDLRRKVIRAVGDPAARFREDYLRILRALRFAARFEFEIDPDTWKAAQANADGLPHLSAERVRDEWSRALLTARRPSQLARSWREVGATDKWLPEAVQSREPGLDQFATRDPVLMTAYLSSDPVATLTRLRSSNHEIARGEAVAVRDRRPDPGDAREVRRWMAERGKAVDDLLTLLVVENPSEAGHLEAAVAAVRGSGAALTLGDLAVHGDDLGKAGIPAGKAMGVILRRLLSEVIDDPTQNERSVLLQRARSLSQRLDAEGGGVKS